ncbi:MAG: hypothetical protein ABI361_07765 [Nitrososphaera sp.]
MATGGNKFVIIMVAIVAVMAALVFLPGINGKNGTNEPVVSPGGQASPSSSSQDVIITLDYGRQNFTSGFSPNSVLNQTGAPSDLLTVSADGSAKLMRFNENASLPREKDFALTSDELSRLHSLILDTGFLQIPDADYPRTDNATKFTRYSLDVHLVNSAGFGTTGDSNSLTSALPSSTTKTMAWVDANATKGSVPPIVRNIGSTLDEIISAHR